ncbi:mannose-1-phosphate guanylyltransferase/mannose-6-phosphate isomerase [Rhodobium orientis]|uniref:mannose-1-phosphate guanylyltransferase n=1 Tax=Rhodobium orientis TaxID=34017 RepID=A0A327JRG4_9HYPH|nr:mannose-1-phosphate guanylyltransferase/mannose-6-phosphate isomerase [Rhodobium orientis]MBB4304802.1 mannose-1-phosphate guanylyltransferase/mannose-6-phosphate isomerase [Rhodobium orientis]MBK5948024.1 mannose-1-phosphate guanylyltransferase/mannose-6-phosphate isomerase [Rhodobium orientis]RAI27492.1 mannose-1-phosphate guanylyltransferase/mannose-6-phosphate isomerase [Rhodobium orientis]
MTSPQAPDRIATVILSGGAGSRLWPLSRAGYPKQFLSFSGGPTLIQQTARRLSGERFSAPLIICNEKHRFLVAEQMRQIDCDPAGILLEPFGRNTAPAAAVAALHLLADAGDGDPLMLIAPSDHVIADEAAFLAAVDRAARAARRGALVTFGIAPDRAETGYGYIRRGGALEGAAEVYAVDRFVEKPDRETAAVYLAEGSYFWNSGIFLFSARTYLGELERHDPAMVAACRNAVAASRRDLTFCRLDQEAFAAARSDSIDYAVMEKTGHAAVVPVDMGWNDLGAWSALWDIGDKDDDGNVVLGDVLQHEASGNFVRTDHHLVAVVGLSNVVVVANDDAVLVADKDRVQEVKAIVERLKAEGRGEHDLHTTVHRPWGSYRGIDRGERFQVKRIVVRPGEKLSLQKHYHRAEHWIVVTGTALVTRGDTTFQLGENESTYIPAGEVHRLENPGKLPLHLIEVQSGSYLGEDDIVRFDDVYAREADEGCGGE